MKTRKGSLIFGFLTALTLLMLVQGSAIANAPNSDSPLGANLHIFTEWSSEYTMVDAFKQSSPWLTQNWSTWNTGELSEIALDEDGWPTSLVSTAGDSNYLWIATLMFDGLGSHYPDGEYTVVYDGTGKIEYAHDATLLRREAGKDFIDVDPHKPTKGILLKITESDPDGTGDYIRNIRVYMPGFDETTTQTFHPTFLENISRYKVLRFMDWQRTNWSAEGPMRSADAVQAEWQHPLHDATQNPYYVYPNSTARDMGGSAEWVDRPEMSNARYSTTNGVPLELMIELSNEIDADPWFNMPHHASDNYMMEFALTVRNLLETNRRVYVEMSNEVWNSGFYQAEWFEEQGKAEWGGEAYENVSDLVKRLNYYGKRSAEMCDIWELAFGAQADRIECVIATQAANTWLGETMLDCSLWEHAPCHAHHVDAVAIAPYFGQHIGNSAYKSVVEGWTTESDDGLGKLFTELEAGGLLDNSVTGTPLTKAKENISAFAAMADVRDIDLVAYEGGQHLVGVGASQSSVLITELFGSANRDPRMANLYADYYAHWRAVGGKMFMHYASLGAYSQWGNWGAQEFAESVGMPKIAANHLFIANNSCDWEACEPPSSYIPTAITLNGSVAATTSIFQLLPVLLLLFSLLVGTTAWLKRS